MSEVLRGTPTTVVGLSDQVAGEIAVDLSDLGTAQVGIIQVNARTLETDESRRNQTIRNRILNTDSYEFITFEPTAVMGLDGSASPGQLLTFQITGDLTIRDVSQDVAFEVTAQVDNANRLVGTAVTTITRAAFDLNIPSVPFVADVGEDVTLTINFTALPA
jgi:polyisoprenoid-binding protein YceI